MGRSPVQRIAALLLTSILIFASTFFAMVQWTELEAAETVFTALQSGEELPDEELPSGELPDEEVPDEEVPGEEVPDEEQPDEELPDEEPITAEALPALLAKSDGADIYLNADITFTQRQSLSAPVSTTIYTNGHSVYIAQDVYILLSNVHIEGTGTVVTLAAGGKLYGEGSVTARGENAVAVSGGLSNVDGLALAAHGDGATALQLAGGTVSQCDFHVTGAGSVGIRSDGDLALEAVNMDCSGLPLDVTGDVSITFCDIESQAGTEIAAGGSVVMDTSYVFPTPSGAQITRRQLIWSDPLDNFLTNGITCEVGAPLDLPQELGFYVSTAGNWDKWQSFDHIAVDWDTSGVDTSTAGSYTATVTPKLPRFLLEDGDAAGTEEILIHIIDPSKPYITGSRWNTQGQFFLSFYQPLTGKETMTVSYSKDEGKTWTDLYLKDDDELYYYGYVVLDNIEVDVLYLFYAVITDGPVTGTTNTRYIWSSAMGKKSPISGDMYGNDRGEQPIPPITVPSRQPDPTPTQTPPQQTDAPSTTPSPAEPTSPIGATPPVGATPLVGATDPDTASQPEGYGVTSPATPAPSSESAQPAIPNDTGAATPTPSAVAAISDKATTTAHRSALPAHFSRILLLLAGAGLACALTALVLYRRRKAKGLQYPLVLISVTLLAAALFSSLYCYDNKYTYPAHPAQDGVTTLSMADYEQQPFLYLVRGWEYYGGQLIAPGDFEDRSPDTTLALGQYGGFELGDVTADPHGCATYRMVIETDGVERDYALELTQIFSKWQLWVNGRLYQSVGMDAPAGADPLPTNRIITFRVAGPIEIVVNVVDEDGFYSGMVYPPAFGSPQAVDGKLTVELLIHSAAFALAVLIGGFCLLGALGFVRRYPDRELGASAKRGMHLPFTHPYWGLFALCLCFALYTAYPMRLAMGLRSAGWLGLEKVAYYAMFLCIVWLHGRLCDLPRTLHRVACALGVAVCMAILIQPIIPVATAAPLIAFSQMLALYKWMVALYLMVTGGWAVWRGMRYSRPLLAGFCVFACGLVLDRLFPLHEPILLGWHAETSGFILMLLIAGILLWDGQKVRRENLVLHQRRLVTEHQLDAQARHARQQLEYMRGTRGVLHESRNQLALLRHYYDAQEYDHLDAYLRQISEETVGLSPVDYTPNNVLNAILFAQFQRAEAAGIHVVKELVDIPATLFIEDGDIASILMNLLDNSIEACQRLPDTEELWIYLRIQYEQDRGLGMQCANAALPPEQTASPTSKDDRLAHGHGLLIVRRLAEKYGGQVEIEQVEDSFTVQMQLPCPPIAAV